MAGRTVARAHLTEAVYREVGLSRNESVQLVESVLEEISRTLARGESVKVSSFGTFSVRDKAQRIGRNPKTGDVFPTLAAARDGVPRLARSQGPDQQVA